ncbi:type 1 glutamine amidotransferase domain-containing protein (plasmid) [Agrobacterium tumefaciens]|uniref:Type 1 glutamine amidotransferase domain-containing protein n=1 Tax=Agrobacterium tumefaciens TaxID=358 RepID=A0AAJ4N8U3_AGRTU|nr:type 1 glutamine amidotransferase domain-containing protein [Agrobacterium tumefaciens]
MKILIVLTSHDRLGDTGRPTGFWFEELAAPYYLLKDAGAEITLASPKGGKPPLDPNSNQPISRSEETRRFEADAQAQAALANSLKLSDVSAADFDAVFYPGGHGPLWDLAEDRLSIALIESFIRADKPFASVCHGPAVLRHVKTADGHPVVQGRKVTGFSNSEENAVGLAGVAPFLIEDEFTSQGGIYSQGPDWSPYVVQDGQIITGQNPASSQATAQALLAALR